MSKYETVRDVSKIEETNFLKYIKGFKLDKEKSSMLILPSNNFFFYCPEEMTHVKTIVSFKKLNFVDDIIDFLTSINGTTNVGTIFCGCFIENKKLTISTKKQHRYSKFFKGLISIMDLQMRRLLSRKNVYDFFGACNYEIINMTEIDGLTYFHAKRVR